MLYEVGDIIEFPENKEYICLSNIIVNGENYIYLMSNFAPVDIKFAKQKPVGDEVALTIVSDRESKQKLLNLFQEEMSKKINQM